MGFLTQKPSFPNLGVFDPVQGRRIHKSANHDCRPQKIARFLSALSVNNMELDMGITDLVDELSISVALPAEIKSCPCRTASTKMGSRTIGAIILRASTRNIEATSSRDYPWMVDIWGPT